MKKNIIITFILLLFAQTLFAAQIGYVDVQKVVNSYPLAQKYKKEVNNKFNEVNNFTKQQEKNLVKSKTEAELIQNKKQAIINVEQKQNEYLELRKKREKEIDLKIKQATEKVRIEKKLDIVIKKDMTLSGGVDITQDVINGLK